MWSSNFKICEGQVYVMIVTLVRDQELRSLLEGFYYPSGVISAVGEDHMGSFLKKSSFIAFLSIKYEERVSQRSPS